MAQHHSWMQRLVQVFLTGKLAPLLLLLSIVAGVAALRLTPREEDPQIIVPVAEIVVDAPCSSAREVERQVATPIEGWLRGISGVEHVYSLSRRGQAVVTARFFVGEDREDSLVKLHATMQQHANELPSLVRGWHANTVSIDDVPILAITLHSSVTDDHGLRRIAEEMVAHLQQVEEAGPVTVHGGRPRQLSVGCDPASLAGRGVTLAAVEQALANASVAVTAGASAQRDRLVTVEASAVAPDAETLRRLVVGTAGGQPVHLGDVATVSDGPAEPTSYVYFYHGAAGGHEHGASAPPEAAVTIGIAKRRGANAVSTAERLHRRLDELRRDLLPADVVCTVTRDSGATAEGKVDELLEGLLVAILVVSALITLMLGWREAIVVALAVPVTFGLSLLVNLLCGYSINRVTLFALILALGLVVDDPIVDVENIHRHLQRRDRPPLDAVLAAVDEVRPPVVVATLAVILSFLPLFSITGMMGPYMAPLALNVPAAMLMSMVVAFTLTPWMSYLALKSDRTGAPGHAAGRQNIAQRAYQALMHLLLRSRGARRLTFGGTGLLFAAALALGALRAVPLKMLPFDNKTELQVLIDLDEGTTLERTAAVVQQLAERARCLPEVVNVTAYSGVPSPIDFNGMVRKYYLRQGAELGELRISLLGKHDRQHQSHQIALRVRELLEPIAERAGGALEVVELPPGPPVLATLVGEVRGPASATAAEFDAAAKALAERLRGEPGVVDVDTSVEAHPLELRYELDREKAALHGIDGSITAAALQTAVGGSVATHLRQPRELHPVPVEVRLQTWQRADVGELGALAVRGRHGHLVPLAEIGTFSEVPREGTIHKKDLQSVAYVLAESAGRPPAEIVLDVDADRVVAADDATPLPPPRPRPVGSRTMMHNGGGVPWRLPAGFTVDWRGEGEWKITVDAFRDLGIAFLVACLGIYLLLVNETRSYLLPLVLMMSIPLTILGILPGFWLLNAIADVPVAGVQNPVFFTATAMVGMIALAGIAVRNSIILIEFVHESEHKGMRLADAIAQSGAARLRPIALTAGSAILAAIPITLDPIFSGLAWSLIFGLVVSSAFTLVLVPVVYYLLRLRRQ